MKNYLKQRVWEITLTIICALLGLCFFSFIAEDCAPVGFALAARQFSNISHMNWYYLGMVGPVEWAYKLLYNTWPDYNWLFISYVVFAYVSLYYFLRSINTVFTQIISNTYVIRVIQILFALGFIENLSSLEYTRSSLIFCGIALFNLAFTSQMSKKRIIFNALIFMLGMFIRPESGLGMLVLVSVGYLIYRFNILHLIRRFWLPALAVISLLTVFAVDRMHTNIFVRKLEPEVEYKIMDKRYIDISAMKTAQDSAKFLAATNALWIDPNLITPEYLRSLLLPGTDFSPEKRNAVLVHSLSFYKYYLFITLFWLLIIAGSFVVPWRWALLFRILVFASFIFLLLYASDYNGFLIAERHFLNIQFMAMLIVLVYFFSNPAVISFFTAARYWVIAGMVLITGALSVTLFSYKSVNNALTAEVANSEKIMQTIDSAYSNRVVVFNLTTMYMLGRKFSFKNNNYHNNTYLIYDFFIYSLTPEYAAYLNAQCHCDSYNPVEFFNWLAPQKPLFVSKPERFDLVEQYMQVVHHYPVKFVSPISINKLANLDPNSKKYWELRSLVMGE